MARMIRKQLYIEPRQEEMLKRRSRELGIAEAELIRQGIEHVLSSDGDREVARLDAWRQIRAFVDKLKNLDVPQTGRDWTREELYEERLSRYPR